MDDTALISAELTGNEGTILRMGTHTRTCRHPPGTGTRDRYPWPLLLIAAPAAVAIWSGWVGLGSKCGFGPVNLLPGIGRGFTVNTAITLPVGIESYGVYAMFAWLSLKDTSERTRDFARKSAIGALVLGVAGQVIYHLLAVAGWAVAPWYVVMLVSCLPVLTVYFAATLTHLILADRRNAADEKAAAERAAAEAEHARVEAERFRAERAALKAVAPARGSAGNRKRSSPRRPARSSPANKPVSSPQDETSEPSAGEPAEPRVPDDVDTQAEALRILAANPGISGAELGRQLGVSKRYGAILNKRLAASVAGPDGGGA